MVLNIIFLILGILGALGFLVYLMRELFAPRFFCRVAGEQRGEPIPLVSGEGRISIAIGTTTKRNAQLLLISVSAQDGVEISGKDGAPILTTDQAFPYAVEFHDTRGVTRNHLQGISVNYKTKTSAFELKIKTLAALREEEQGFLLDMFAPRKITSERIVGFRVDPNLNLIAAKIICQ